MVITLLWFVRSSSENVFGAYIKSSPHNEHQTNVDDNQILRTGKYTENKNKKFKANRISREDVF